MDKYIFITRDGAPLSIADRLQDDGKEVIVGLITDKETEKLSKDKNACREQLYDGILDIHDAEDTLTWMAKLKNKDEWFVMFDYGDLFPYSERALEMGFSKGVYPTEEGYTLERDRKAGKAFAKKNYPRLTVAPVHEFQKAQDAIKFLTEQKKDIFVLKSEGSNAETVVPLTQDVDLARKQVIGALRTETKGYEKEGFTLEAKIQNAVELSPVMVFWEGKPLFSLLELENKPLGCGLVGRLTGGCQNLTIRTPMDCELNKIAFPQIVFDMAKKQPGVGIFDCGLLFDGKEFYFTEFCSQRWGWDGLFSEIAMCGDEHGHGSVTAHFDGIASGRNPLRFSFGSAVRLFQTEPSSKKLDCYESGYAMDWSNEVSEQLFFYDIRKEYLEDSNEDVFVSVGVEKELGVATGASDRPEQAVDRAYKAAEGFAMTGVYYRHRPDFLSKDYFSSIGNRWDFLKNSGLIG